MTITMVKKTLLGGAPCKKCIQAEDVLRRRGLWERIDEVVYAVEGDDASAGMKLARRHGVELAPFFVVSDERGERVYDSVIPLMKAELAGESSPAPAAAPVDVEAIARELSGASPEEIVRWGLERYGRDCAIAFSGAEDVVLIHMAAKCGAPFTVLTLDTGRLHPETHRYVDDVRQRYGLDLHVAFPDALAVEALVRKKGLFSFYADGHEECCEIRKVEPLRRALAARRAWMSGRRRDQSPATRSELAVVELDATVTGPTGPLLKLNPLASWSSDDTWAYLRAEGIPHNPLHERGFRSIGCEPCTRATLPGEHERAGRWWWEDATKRECGLHIRRA